MPRPTRRVRRDRRRALAPALIAGVLGVCAPGDVSNAQNARELPAHPAERDNAFAVRALSPDGLWAALEFIPQRETDREAYIRPDFSSPVVLDLAETRALLTNAPTEADVQDGARGMLFDLPMPDGGFDTFEVYATPILAPGLAARYPQIRTYAGTSPSDPTASVRITVTALGFDAFVLRAGPDIFVDRYSVGQDTVYTSYFGEDLDRPGLVWTCSADTNGANQARQVREFEPFGRNQQTLAPVTLRTFQAAIAATGEYTQFFGGTVAQGLSAVTTAMNRVSGIYERELAARFQLVPTNDRIIYTNPSTDPFGSISLSQIDQVIDSQIGSANYDVGHLVDTGGGGFAQLGVVCTGSKGRGYTGLTPPSGDRFFVDYLAHELGHQFNATHTFNGDSGSCAGGNRTASTAYEPGSASTIMGYAAICGNDNIQNFSDDYFHWISLQQMSGHIASRTCDAETGTGNNTPVANAGPDIIVPLNTPFRLTGSGTDQDADTLTYTWEQADLGPRRDVSLPDDGTGPIFRSFEGTTSPTRLLPRTTDWRDGSLQRGEKLPIVPRTLNFNLVVRDNAPGGGGYDVDSMRVNVIGSAGPFRVTSQNAATTNTTGVLDITWDVANTTASPLNESAVNILFSTDNAQTFPIVLAQGTPNDGAETVTLPEGLTTSSGYLMVEAADGNFFDINKGRISVEVPVDPVEFGFPQGLPSQLAGGEPTVIQFSVNPGGFTLAPPLFAIYGYDAPPSNFALVTALGNDLYEVTLPPADCDQTAEFYLFVPTTGGETFTSPADFSVPYTADVVCNSCPADANGDGTVNVLDVVDFINTWNVSAPGSDFNNDGSVNVLDVVAFITVWNAGCP